MRLCPRLRVCASVRLCMCMCVCVAGVGALCGRGPRAHRVGPPPVIATWGALWAHIAARALALGGACDLGFAVRVSAAEARSLATSAAKRPSVCQLRARGRVQQSPGRSDH